GRRSRRAARPVERARQTEDRAVEISALDRRRRQPAENRHRQDPAFQTAGSRQVNLNPTGSLVIGSSAIGSTELEYRMTGPSQDAAPTIVLLHEGLGCAAPWGDFPERLAAATGTGGFAYSRAGHRAFSA